MVDDNVLCYPSPMGWDSCLLGEHFLYAFQAPTPRAGDDVLEAHDLGLNTTVAVGAPLTKFCRELFDVDM